MPDTKGCKLTGEGDCLHIVFAKVSVPSIVSLLDKFVRLCLTHCNQARLQATLWTLVVRWLPLTS